jgi:hypothetical protein
MKRFGLSLGLGALGTALVIAACGGTVTDSGGNTSSSSSSSSGDGGSSSSSSSSGDGGSSGSSTTSTSSGGGSGGASSSSSSGGNNYATCDECLAEGGAIANECQAEYTACLEWKSCNSLMYCNDAGVPNGPGACDKTTVKGACCSLQCDANLPDPEGIMRYRALDACLHCATCVSVCNSAEYCKVFEPDGETLCAPK